MAFTCPSCQRPIYIRRRETCEFCGKTIPAALVLNPEQRTALERIKTAAAKEHRDFMARGGSGWTSDGIKVVD